MYECVNAYNGNCDANACYSFSASVSEAIVNYCLYIGCRRKCDDRLYCNTEHELKQRRVVNVLAARKDWSAAKWKNYEKQRLGRYGGGTK